MDAFVNGLRANEYAYLISICTILYYLWIVTIEYKKYTGFYYEPFLILAFMAAAATVQWLADGIFIRQQTIRKANRISMVSRYRAVIAVILVVLLGIAHIAVVVETRPRHSDADIYREIYGFMERFPETRNEAAWFDQHLWSISRLGEFHSFVFCLRKFNVQPRYFSYAEDPPVEMTGRESQHPIYMNNESPEWVFLAGHHTDIPDAVAHIFTDLKIVDTGNHVTLCRCTDHCFRTMQTPLRPSIWTSSGFFVRTCTKNSVRSTSGWDFSQPVSR